MARPRSVDSRLVDHAKALATQAQTADELRRAQAVLLPALLDATLEQTAAALGVGRATVVRYQAKVRGRLTHPARLPPQWGGRRRAAMSWEEEQEFLQPWAALSADGSMLVVAPLRAVAPSLKKRPSFGKVFSAVWLPGIGLAISGVGFGAVTTFLVLLFAQHVWAQAWLAITLLSIAFITGRVFFGHLPDRGGVKVALVCILIEAVGQALIWLAPQPALAFVGVTLTGLGYSLVYPSFGVEALRRAPAESRGLAMGAFTSFLDLSLGLTGPALGLVASGVGLDSVFLVSTLVVLGSLAIAARLLFASPLEEKAV